MAFNRFFNNLLILNVILNILGSKAIAGRKGGRHENIF